VKGNRVYHVKEMKKWKLRTRKNNCRGVDSWELARRPWVRQSELSGSPDKPTALFWKLCA
jgi:hypothetical protein